MTYNELKDKLEKVYSYAFTDNILAIVTERLLKLKVKDYRNHKYKYNISIFDGLLAIGTKFDKETGVWTYFNIEEMTNDFINK